MKKYLLYPLFMAGICCAACEPAENTYHHTSVYYPATGYSVLYADQTRDSLSLVSFDSYTITLYGDWIQAKESDLSFQVPSGSYVEGSIYFDFLPNTTGETRECHVVLSAYGNDFPVYYRQVPYLNISRPAMNQEGAYRRDVKYDALKDSLIFRPYGDWTLAFDGEKPEWIDWQEGAVTSGEAGLHKVVYTLKKNETLDPREARLTLTSNGVKSGVTVVQQNQKD